MKLSVFMMHRLARGALTNTVCPLAGWALGSSTPIRLKLPSPVALTTRLTGPIEGISYASSREERRVRTIGTFFDRRSEARWRMYLGAWMMYEFQMCAWGCPPGMGYVSRVTSQI